MTLLATVVVTIFTSLGTIHVALDDVHAPKTVANFLWYVRHGAYDGGRFHRTVTTRPDNQPHNRVKIDVIQAGNAPAWNAHLRPPVVFESTARTGLRHLDGTISMARDVAPDTAQADFFICIGAQPSLDDGGHRSADHRGFAAFGRVTSGMDVVRAIHAAHADGQTLAPPIPITRITTLRISTDGGTPGDGIALSYARRLRLRHHAGNRAGVATGDSDRDVDRRRSVRVAAARSVLGAG